MSSFIPVYQPELSGNEKKYVNECLDSNWISSKGDFIQRFENGFSAFTGSSYAVSVSNGTVALHLALLVLGVGAGDEVIVPSFTYIASVNAIRYVGAIPVFVDIEPQSWQLNCEHVNSCITSRTKAIMAVHIYGQPCDLKQLRKIADDNQLFLIEDCAEAFGSKIDNQHVGTIGDISTYSFFGNKTITTGEGGMVVTNDSELAKQVRHLKGQGLMAEREYWHDAVGYNYRMTNICAAIGLAQLEQATVFIQRKQELAYFYISQLEGLPLTFQQSQPNTTHSWWMFSVLTNTASERDALRAHLAAAGIETRPLFNPVHLMPMYQQKGFHLPVSEQFSCRGINLPSWPGLTTELRQRIVAEVKAFFE